MASLERQLLEIGDIQVIAALLFCGMMFFFLLPRERRLELSLFGLAVAQTIARLVDLGAAASIAMALIIGFYIAIIASIAFGGEEGARWNDWTWILVLSSGASIFYVVQATDAAKAVILRVEWLLLVVSAAMTAGSVKTQDQLLRVMKAICLGLGVGCLVCFWPLIDNPASAISAGFGRFTPYGANPNQIGITFAIAAIFGAYIWLRTNDLIPRILCGGAAALGAALLLLTVSRMAVLICAVALLPLLPFLLRRPLHAIVLFCVMCGGAYKVVAAVSEASFDRIDQGLDRSNWWELGYEEFCRRPILGMYGVKDLPAVEIDERDNSHNAYLSILYLGGLSIGIPIFLCQLRGVIAAIQMSRKCDRTAYDPILIGILAGCSVMQVVHGFANEIIYYPTYIWAFWNIFCIVFFTNQLRLKDLRSASSMLPVSQNRQTRRSGIPYREFRPVLARRIS